MYFSGKLEREFKDVMVAIEEDLERERIRASRIVAMPNLHKNKTGLPVNIWFDKVKSYEKGGHWKRIKVQLNKANNFQEENSLVLSLEDEPQIKGKKGKMEISQGDIDEVIDFVKEHKGLLLRIADKDEGALEELLEEIKGG